MKVEVEKYYGATAITVEHAESPILFLQIYPAGVTPEEAGKALMENMRESLSELGAKILGKWEGARRRIAGAERAGRVLRTSLGGMEHRTEIYSFPWKGRTTAVTVQHALEDGKIAAPRFRAILDSLK